MKKILTVFTAALAFSFIFHFSSAQIQTPAPSPAGKIEQKVGLTDVTINYSRPGVKGRKIFVDVEEYGKMWRTGANNATTIAFSDDVKLEGKEVPAGKYAIYSIPGKKQWTIMIYKDLGIGGNVSAYDESEELTRFTVNSVKNPNHVENLTFDIGDLKDESATIRLKWSDIIVPIQMTVDTKTKVMASINRFAKNPNASLVNQYASAANYYFANDMDLNKALEWISKAVEYNPNAFWHVQTKARIQAKMKDYKGAIATANQSMELAKSAQSDFGYIKSNQKYIEKWSKLQ
ncbi:MAG: DUF2911 domain-containing protein [Cytophagales bacterium]|nr:DUF2911 domain-containing protein [Cytophagales bacterium]